MPYRSKAQRAFMHIHHPEIAARWDRETGGKIVPKKTHAKKKAAKRKAAPKRRTTRRY